MRIANNIMALNAHRQLMINQGGAAKSIEKLSSGLRINRAGDDAAGLAISEKMRGQIRGLNQAIRNAQDGISLIQTAEGALTETHAILQRMRELAVQASNDTNTAEDREEIQREIDQLIEELDRIASTTEFNTKKLLDGAIGLRVADGTIIGKVSSGPNTKEGTYVVDASNATLATHATTGGLGVTAEDTVNAPGTLTINGVDIEVTATDTFRDVANKINASVSGVVAEFDDTSGELVIRSESVGASAQITIRATAEIVSGTNWHTTPADLTGQNASGLAASNFGTGASLVYNGNRVTVVGGDADGLTFTLKDNSADTTITVNDHLSLHIGANEGQTMQINVNAMDATSLGVAGIDVTTAIGAESAISALDDAIQAVSSERSKLGAYQNRLEHTIANLGASAENLQAAESRIRDVDMAAEMMTFTKYQILQQASTAMLAQANLAPQSVLQLLG